MIYGSTCLEGSLTGTSHQNYSSGQLTGMNDLLSHRILPCLQYQLWVPFYGTDLETVSCPGSYITCFLFIFFSFSSSLLFFFLFSVFSMLGHTCNSGTWEGEAGGSCVWNQLGYMIRLYLYFWKKKTKQNKCALNIHRVLLRFTHMHVKYFDYIHPISFSGPACFLLLPSTFQITYLPFSHLCF